MYTDKAAVNPVIKVDPTTSSHVVTSINSYDAPIFYRGRAVPSIEVVEQYGITKMKPDKIICYSDGIREAVINDMVVVAAKGERTFQRLI